MLKVVTNDILQVISEPDMTNNVLTVQYDAQQVNFADIAISDLTWTDLNVAEMPTAFTTQDQVIWSATVANNGQADATFTLTLYVDGQVAAQRQVFRAKGASAVESFTIAPTAGVHTVTLTAGGELMDSDERNNSATVTTGEFTVTVPGAHPQRHCYRACRRRKPGAGLHPALHRPGEQHRQHHRALLRHLPGGRQALEERASGPARGEQRGAPGRPAPGGLC